METEGPPRASKSLGAASLWRGTDAAEAGAVSAARSPQSRSSAGRGASSQARRSRGGACLAAEVAKAKALSGAADCTAGLRCVWSVPGGSLLQRGGAINHDGWVVVKRGPILTPLLMAPLTAPSGRAQKETIWDKHPLGGPPRSTGTSIVRIQHCNADHRPCKASGMLDVNLLLVGGRWATTGQNDTHTHTLS